MAEIKATPSVQTCCARCHQPLPPEAFSRDVSRPSGLHPYCRGCRSAEKAQHYQRHKARVLAGSRRAYETKKADPGYVAARRDYQREYARAKPDRLRASTLLGAARLRARALGLPCTITQDWLCERLTRGVCEVTGLAFVRETRPAATGRKPLPHPFTASLDRRDPRQGYTEDNARVVLWCYNAAKGPNTDEDVLAMARALVAVADGCAG